MHRRVLLALRLVSPVERLFSIGASLSRRLDAELEVLADPERPDWAQIVMQLSAMNRADLNCRLTPMPGLNAHQVVEYARDHENVVSVVVGRPEAWDNPTSSNPWSRLECPLVAASDHPSHPREI